MQASGYINCNALRFKKVTFKESESFYAPLAPEEIIPKKIFKKQVKEIGKYIYIFDVNHNGIHHWQFFQNFLLNIVL